MRRLWMYVVGALFVFWFSVSGGMHNIIRGVPLYYFNQQGQARAFPGLMPEGVKALCCFLLLL